MNELKHGELAIVERESGAQTLAQYRDFAGDGLGAHWAYFGTEWVDQPERVRVIARAAVVTTP